ncbi:hypothetical protein BSKO_05115 [Bryopsis sp. KO-2023]|nr:hypothetical protein BSKO_05115 [Bryopsis sp. KO-2023]
MDLRTRLSEAKATLKAKEDELKRLQQKVDLRRKRESIRKFTKQHSALKLSTPPEYIKEIVENVRNQMEAESAGEGRIQARNSMPFSQWSEGCEKCKEIESHRGWATMHSRKPSSEFTQFDRTKTSEEDSGSWRIGSQAVVVKTVSIGDELELDLNGQVKESKLESEMTLADCKYREVKAENQKLKEQRIADLKEICFLRAQIFRKEKAGFD